MQGDNPTPDPQIVQQASVPMTIITIVVAHNPDNLGECQVNVNAAGAVAGNGNVLAELTHTAAQMFKPPRIVVPDIVIPPNGFPH